MEIKNTKNIYETLIAVMNDVPAIGKDHKNMSQGFSFRGVDDVVNELHHIFIKHKLFVAPTKITELSRDIKSTKSGGEMYFTNLLIQYTFYAEDGSSITVEVKGEGSDNNDKSSNKAMAVAFKYALCQTLMIPTEGKEPEGEPNPEIIKNETQDSNETYCCELCGKPFEEVVSNGKKYTPKDLYEGAKMKYDGLALCKEHGKEYLSNKGGK